ncbi:MAG: hypothetical protein JNJ54_35975 [Myxococcaceae bacterium]|nr:hypothetical protein [Myxococcaceae bacterium]
MPRLVAMWCALTAVAAPAVPAGVQVMPGQGVDRPGQRLVLRGCGLSAASTVQVGGRPCANLTVVSAGELACDLPVGLALGFHQIDVAPGLTLPRAFFSLGAPILWLSAERLQGNADGGIETWPDGSGFGHDCRQPAPASRPRWRTGGPGGLPTVDFASVDGTADWLAVSDTPALRPGQLSAAAVIVPVGVSAWGKVLSKDYNATGTWASPYVSYNLSSSFAATGAPYWEVALGGAEGKLQATQPLPSGSPAMLVGTFDNLELRFWVDGANPVTRGWVGPIDYNGRSSDLAIGARSPYTPAEFFTGSISELVLYGQALSTPQRLELEAYLAGRYRLDGGLVTDAGTVVCATGDDGGAGDAGSGDDGDAGTEASLPAGRSDFGVRSDCASSPATAPGALFVVAAARALRRRRRAQWTVRRGRH